MTEGKKNTSPSKMIIRTPRIIAIMFSLLMIINTLKLNLPTTLSGRQYILLRMPAVVFVGVALLSRKRSLYGAIFFLIFGIWYIIQGRHFPIISIMIRELPILATAVLFFFQRWKKRRKSL